MGNCGLAGTGVAEGYLNDPELTDAKFVAIDGVRWYKTGDLVGIILQDCRISG